jgi:hypothetical protein
MLPVDSSVALQRKIYQDREDILTYDPETLRRLYPQHTVMDTFHGYTPEGRAASEFDRLVQKLLVATGLEHEDASFTHGALDHTNRIARLLRVLDWLHYDQ